MFYLAATPTAGTGITISTTGDNLRKFNSGKTFASSITLNELGIAIIEIRENNTLTIIIPAGYKVIFSNLSLINMDGTTVLLNEALGLQAMSNEIFDLLKPYSDFYYNAPIDNSLAIEINTKMGETLLSPEIWYDYNNINNKFVISEIDATKLKDGIVISKSSKR